MGELGARWIANESARAIPDVAAKARAEIPDSRFVLALDGAPLAATGPHGQSIDWLA